MSAFANPVCVALDTKDMTRARTLASDLHGKVGFVKLGMEFFYANGADGYRAVADAGIPVFLDLKLHDIPNTVAEGMRSLMQLDPAPAITTVHATGGLSMLRAAAAAMHGSTRLVAITVLTSLSKDDLNAAGFAADQSTLAHAVNLAGLAKAGGTAGVVCSPHDVAAIKQACGEDFLTVVPGIRPTGTDAADQKRVATPRAACDAGADVLVIGRAITTASDPVAAAEAVLATLDL